jgi:hypothetical protein
MANAYRPSGLSPVKHLNGSPFNGQGNIYCIAAADTSGYAIGDPVQLDSTTGSDSNGVPAIKAFVAKQKIVGVILGLGTSEGGIFNPDDLNSTVRPAAAQTDNWYAIVADSPDIIFEVSEATGGTAFTATDVGTRKNLSGFGTNNGFVSSCVVSETDPVTGDVPPITLLGLARRADNAFGNGARWLALVTDHAYANNAVAV